MTSTSPSGAGPTAEPQSPTVIQEGEDEKEDEEDDEDFNPLYLQILSPEASSSLSSENEPSPNPKSDLPVPITTAQDQRLTIPFTEEEEEAETVMQTGEGSLGQAIETPAKEHCDGDVADDAICRRTRARYSLANFTLDELETFLQETDDEDDFQNADDQEYRKFLAAVLQGEGDGDPETIGNENACGGDDDDEENDADFKVEIEEALESDCGGEERQPETRQTRRQKACARSRRKNKKLLGQAKAPLRPILPSVLNGQFVPPLPAPPLLPIFRPPFLQHDQMMGFTAYQIGQLHCLIYEHIQLLIQVYTLCVTDPSRQHIASDVERMILEMVNKRDEALAQRKIPHSDFCFQHPNVCPSASDTCPQPRWTQLDSSNESNTLTDCNTKATSSLCNTASHSDYDRPHAQAVDVPLNSGVSIWMPVINGPVRSVLDVAPLSLVKGYVADVSMAVDVHKQHHVEAILSSTHFEKAPLFPLPSLRTSAEEAANEPSAAPTDKAQLPKKSLAAMLVESTKQSVALVRKDIVQLAQTFLPLFNSALFPHKPPPAAIAKRVLFTDAEDELLAMGLMEYNNDWKSIQQRFLPCKSKHQIFVRQKNRSSSKAPENPIKRVLSRPPLINTVEGGYSNPSDLQAVRRMKTSPLTAEEKARIHEGLKILKLDWMSVWKLLVPYRDPTLLPRQWRIAIGTQKSYKTSDAAKEKRRLYESRRRKLKKAEASLETLSEKEADNADGGDNSADGNMDDEDEAYLHEALLADWRPRCSGPMSSELPHSNVSCMNASENQAGIMSAYGGSGSAHEYSTSLMAPCNLQPITHFAHVRCSAPYTVSSSQMTPNLKAKPFRPYRMRRTNQLVKLAPDLPPVNLPPSVRVISQSAFKSYNYELPISKTHSCETENLVSRPHVAKSGGNGESVVKNRIAPPQSNTENHSPQDPRTPANLPITEESGTETDLQMHPLLFQDPEDGRLPYFPANDITNSSSSFSFFPGNPFQANLNLFHKSQQAVSTFDCFHPALRSKEKPSDLSTIDFHPLLQRTDNVDRNPESGSSLVHLCSDSESLQGNYDRISNPSNPILTAQQDTDDQSAAPPSIYCEKANELDLDIHLSTSRKDKISGSRGRMECDLAGVTAGNHRNIEARQQNDVISFNNTEAYSSTSFEASSYMSSVNDIAKMDLRIRSGNDTHVAAHEMALSGNDISRFCEVDQGGDSLPGIVMEQEELSDSDEEMEEDVEFECEEMADSEGEGMYCDQPADIQNKVVTTVSEKGNQFITKPDQDGQRACYQWSNNIHANEGNERSCKLGSSGKPKNTMNSCTPGCSSAKMKRERRKQVGQDQSNRLQLHPNRLSKKLPKAEGVTLRSQESTQPHLDSTTAECSSVVPLRKPRKRVCRANAEIATDNTIKHSGNCEVANIPSENCSDSSALLNI